MLRKSKIIILILLSTSACRNTRSDSPISNFDRTTYNLDFEYRYEGTDQPAYWQTSNSVRNGYCATADTDQKQHGKSSLKLTRTGTPGEWGFFCQTLPAGLVKGKVVELTGWIRTQAVGKGFARLYVYSKDDNPPVSMLNDPADQGVRNTTGWTRVSVKKRIGDHVEYVTFGGILKGPGTAWFDNLELRIDGVKLLDTQAITRKTDLTPQEQAELRKYVYPLPIHPSDDCNGDDLKILKKLIGNSSVVALGENTHGSSETFRMKNRLIRYLAENEDFDIFSIEANMPESYKLNEYTIEGKGDPAKLIAGMYFWTWNTQEMLALVEWMHEFNGSQRKICYTGFDMQFYEGSMGELREALKQDKQAETYISDLVAAFKILKYNSAEPTVSFANTSIRELEKRVERLSIDESRKEWLRHNITLLKQYTQNHLNKTRDRFMADNLMWIKTRNPSSRIVIWAHNGHIMKKDGVMGDYLKHELGNDYLTFGFSFYEGSYLATGDRGLSSYAAQCAYPGTLEYLLNQLDEPLFILDLKKIQAENSPVMEWINDLEFRFVGGAKISHEFTPRRITDDFDYLIFIRESTPSCLLQ